MQINGRVIIDINCHHNKEFTLEFAFFFSYLFGLKNEI